MKVYMWFIRKLFNHEVAIDTNDFFIFSWCFKVHVIKCDFIQIINKHEASVFWRTWWFISLCLCVCVTVIHTLQGETRWLKKDQTLFLCVWLWYPISEPVIAPLGHYNLSIKIHTITIAIRLPLLCNTVWEPTAKHMYSTNVWTTVTLHVKVNEYWRM